MTDARPLRIIQVFNRYLLPGGEERSVGRMAEDLRLGGHHVAQFWRASEEWKRPGGPAKWQQAFLLLNNPSVLDELQALHEREHADLWLFHNVIPVVSLGVYRRALQLNVPVIQWLHNYRPISVGGALFAGPKQLTPEDRWGNLKESLAGSWNGRLMTSWLTLAYARIKRRGDYRSVKAWVAVSDEMKRIFARAQWFPDRLHSVRHSWHLTQSPVSGIDEGHFLFLGRMVEEKGVRFLVDLWRDPVLKSRTLVMAGQGPLADELRSHSPSNVKWVGQVEGELKRNLIAGCRAIVFPCLWAEPLSTVAYEAYEQGKPILASDLGGMKEIILERKTGRLLPAGDKTSWLSALTTLDRAESARLGQAGRSWLEAHVSPDVWNRQFALIAAGVLRETR